jgi:predicted DsbA family dithiol-disulfide isomerase
VASVRVDVWSDVVCPWCYIGKRRFERALEVLREQGNDPGIDVVYRSFQLDPGAPVDDPVPVREAYAAKFGGAARADAIHDHVTRTAAEEGIEFRMDIAVRANTLLAHRALHFARLDDSGAQGRVKQRLLAAYFTEGRNIADQAVVEGCVAESGLDPLLLREWLAGGGGTSEVAADIAEAARRDITAVPSYVIDDRFTIPGAQDPATFATILGRMLAR